MNSSRAFGRTVLGYWKKNGRHNLPWRKTHDPYKILVSEIMLQQTQVERVVPYFKRFIRKFPTIGRLASASLASVLQSWSGLGYNRRAKLLRECAKEIMEKHGGTIPKDRPALVALPGIGPYTAGAIRTFAFNEREIFIETNIRAALIYHFFPKSKKIPDSTLLPVLASLVDACTLSYDRGGKIALTQKLPHQFRYRGRRGGAAPVSPRLWYSALMDYGAHIKRTHANPSRRSSHHTRQSPFAGSLRQLRGVVLRKLLDGPINEAALLRVDVKNSYMMETALRDLEREGMIENKRKRWCLTNS